MCAYSQFVDWSQWFINELLMPSFIFNMIMPEKYIKTKIPMVVIVLSLIMFIYGLIEFQIIANMDFSKPEQNRDTFDLMGWCRWKGLQKGYLWTLVTYNFFHNEMYHLCTNIGVLVQFGLLFNQIVGNYQFIIVFFACSSIAAVIKLQTHDPEFGVIGSSAGIYGIMGALFVSLVDHWNKLEKGRGRESAIMLILANVGYEFVAHLQTFTKGVNFQDLFLALV